MNNEINTRAYAQWVEIDIFAENMDVIIKKVNLKWGKFYEQGNKDKEIKPDEINGYVIKSGKSYKIYSCGRENASSGTEGSISLYHENELLGKYYWDCPWGNKTNKDNLSDVTKDPQYEISKEGGNYQSGALGNIKITCRKKS
ncbi:aegerolysin family protein [Pectobacterium parmentieri]|uniref:aegerolysin family protein n=1 Tax=Pectobacterium parmentieri TaxID=1905730 RepID=UPI0018DF586F|nr:aegerolysin family protein [Pectobacterium parmentieri]MBI0551571.1 aegerolysin [Pectobacterium parmentieri]MBI0560613.1 aegerolysin [Pectobacterium parmentieri]MBI0564540.1 aegerolysin [Pectobacterium parmentieri]